MRHPGSADTGVCDAADMGSETKAIIETIVGTRLVVAGLLSAQIAGVNMRVDDLRADLPVVGDGDCCAPFHVTDALAEVGLQLTYSGPSLSHLYPWQRIGLGAEIGPGTELVGRHVVTVLGGTAPRLRSPA